MMAPGARVTVIDGEAESRELIAEILESEGYRVTMLESATPTLDAIEASHPDLLVIDLGIGHSQTQLDGWDIARLAKANRHLQRVPILVVSADLPRLRQLVPETMERRGIFLLGKPFALDSLTVMASLALDGTERPLPIGDIAGVHLQDFIS